jgi:hypothetical protein
MSMAIVKTVFVASRPACTVFDASGLKQEHDKRKYNLINVNHSRDDSLTSESLMMVVRSCSRSFCVSGR